MARRTRSEVTPILPGFRNLLNEADEKDEKNYSSNTASVVEEEMIMQCRQDMVDLSVNAVPRRQNC